MKVAVNELLNLEQIREVQIDKKAILTSGYWMNSHPDLKTDDLEWFKHGVAVNFDVTEDDEYIHIRKKLKE